MATTPPAPDLSPRELRFLADAVRMMEYPNVAARTLTATGGPTDRFFGAIAAMTSGDVKAAVKSGVRKCLDLAVSPLQTVNAPAGNPDWFTIALTGFTGGVAGVVGLAAMPIELPITTVITIRCIAQIARREGEDLSRKEAWLACMEVFSLAGLSQIKGDVDRYYRTRATAAARLDDAMAARLLDHHVGDASTLVLIRLMGEALGRLMLIVTDVTAAAAFPVVGFGVGATLNMILMDHFQKIARSHFAIRRLERKYGFETVRRRYLALAADLRARLEPAGGSGASTRPVLAA